MRRTGHRLVREIDLPWVRHPKRPRTSPPVGQEPKWQNMAILLSVSLIMSLFPVM